MEHAKRGIADPLIRTRAERRFAELRRTARLPDRIPPVADGWCVSTIARIVHNAPSLLAEIEALQSGAYVYPAASLHVSLMGCTPREPSPPAADRAAAIAAVVRDVLARVGEPVPVEIGRLNAIGAQLFLEVLTDSPAWARMRTAVADAMDAPMRHPDPEPMHLNIARVTSPPDLSGGLMRHAVLSRIEVVVTDFLVSPETLVVVDSIELGRDA